MKKIKTILVLASILVSWTMFAAPAKIEDSVRKLAADYEKVEGFDCLIIQKGEGLGLVKSMFNQSFGRKFMKGVTSIIMIDYSKASEEKVKEIHGIFDGFSATLEEIDLGEEEIQPGEYLKCFGKVEGKTVSDFMIIMEDAEGKMLVYMGGVLNLEKLDFKN